MAKSTGLFHTGSFLEQHYKYEKLIYSYHNTVFTKLIYTF